MGDILSQAIMTPVGGRDILGNFRPKNIKTEGGHFVLGNFDPPWLGEEISQAILAQNIEMQEGNFILGNYDPLGGKKYPRQFWLMELKI